MKKLLIVRSVSFQQLDLNLPEIKKQFPDYKIHLLTHEHGVKLAEKYETIEGIYIYPYVGSFNKKNKIEALNKEQFDAIIIPVTNITGVGFLNVLSYGLSLRSKKYYRCNMISEFKEMNKGYIFFKVLESGLYKLVAALLSLPIILLSLCVLPFKLKTLEHQEKR